MAERLVSSQETAGSIPVIRSQSQGCAWPAANASRGGSSARSFVVVARSPSVADGLDSHEVAAGLSVWSPGCDRPVWCPRPFRESSSIVLAVRCDRADGPGGPGALFSPSWGNGFSLPVFQSGDTGSIPVEGTSLL